MAILLQTCNVILQFLCYPQSGQFKSLAIGRKATLAPKFEYKPRIPITGTHTEAKEKLQEKLAYFRKRLEDFRSNRMAIMNKDRQPHGFTVGQIVYNV